MIKGGFVRLGGFIINWFFMEIYLDIIRKFIGFIIKFPETFSEPN